MTKPNPNFSSKEEECTHHWVLGKQSGDTIPMECKLCGDNQDVPTPTHDMNWRHHYNLRRKRVK
jgi:hypothetical protein